MALTIPQRVMQWGTKAARSLRQGIPAFAVTMDEWKAPTYFTFSYENYVREGFRKSQIIYACIHTTASTTASVAARVHNLEDQAVLTQHPLAELIAHPNPHMSQAVFWYQTIAALKVAGVAYAQKIRNSAGDVVQLWPLRPDYMEPHRDKEKFIDYFKYTESGADPIAIDANDVIRWYLPDLLDIYGQQSPIDVLARIADVDNAVTDWIKVFFERGGLPMGVLTSKLRLKDDAVTDLLQRWRQRYGGYQNWDTPAILDSDASYQKVGMSVSELRVEGIDGRNETRICMVLEVPPILIGSTFGLMRSTFSNFDSAIKAWWQGPLAFLYRLLADGINNQLATEWRTPGSTHDAVEMRWDLSSVPVFEELRQQRAAQAVVTWQSGGITRNELRKVLGESQLPPELGDVFAIPSTSTLSAEPPGTPESPDTDTGLESEGDIADVATEDTSDTTNTTKSLKPKAGKTKPKGNGKHTIEVEPFTEAQIAAYAAKYKALPGLTDVKKGA